MNKTPLILLAEDDASARAALTRLLQSEGYTVQAVASAEDARRMMSADIDLVLSDLRMPGATGMDLLNWWHRAHPTTPFILMTAYGEIKEAVQAMKMGADDFLSKPVHAGQLLTIVRNCLGRHHECDPAGCTPPSPSELDAIVGESEPMRDVKAQIVRAARAESTVLVLGESGTGKELVAHAIHQNSPRRKGPFIAVNMAAVPDTLVESELFGHVKGSFTGAVGNRVGRLQAAQEGTIFIDEIGDFALASQAKLLRVLETRTITPVGGNDERPVDVRVVAATSRNLEELVENREFREDLYYRLSVVTLSLPPLRDRLDDVPLLVNHFLKQLSQANQKPHLELSPDVLDFMKNFDWPGNVRQLRNCLESMVVMSEKPALTMDDLPPTLVRSERKSAGSVPLDTTIEDMEKSAILRALEQCHGNRTRAAETLGISVRTLQRRLHNWGITTPTA